MIDDEIEDIRSVKDKDKLSYNLLLQKHADLCLKYWANIINLPVTVDAFKAALFFDVPGLQFKSRIEEFELKDIFIPQYIEICVLKSDRDIWHNPIKKEGLMEMLNFRYAKKRYNFLTQLLAEHSALMAAKGYVVEGTELGIK